MAEVGHSLAETEADKHKSTTLDSTVKAPFVRRPDHIGAQDGDGNFALVWLQPLQLHGIYLFTD
jgi:hypothetical protein